jgi:hypothetical protein
MVNDQVQVSADLAHGQSPYCLFAGRSGGNHSSLNRYGNEKNVLSLLEIEPRFFGLPAHSLVTGLTEILNLLGKGK